MKKTKNAQRHKMQEVNWQPLSRMPLITQLIDESVADAEEQHRMLTKRAQVFDDALIARLKKFHQEQLEYAAVYSEQIERWQKEAVTSDERFELVRLSKQCGRLKELSTAILTMADEIGEETIDKILGMDDAELGLMTLLGDKKPGSSQPEKRQAANVRVMLPTLTVNRRFLEEFSSAEAPCLALGLVEERGETSGFLALRPDEIILPEITDKGFRFGHQLLGIGNKDFEVVLFSFEFYGFETYNVLVNPNNAIAKTVLSSMVERGDYFFFAVNPNGAVTAFRSEIANEDLCGLKTNFPRIENSRTTDIEYQKVLSRFAKNPQPAGRLLRWVCRDDVGYLDLSRDRLDLTPAPV